MTDTSQASRSFRTLIAMSAIAIAATSAIGATTLVKKNLDELVKESDAIVVGTVSDIQAQFDATREIHSFVTLTDLQVIHGEYHESTLTLRVRGGRVANVVRTVVGGPRFDLSERVLLFVQGNGQHLVPLVGWTQGVFRITRDERTDRQTVFDHDRNPVLAVRGRDLVTQQINAPAADLVAPDGTISRPGASAGLTNDGSPSSVLDVAAGRAEQALDVDAFIAAVSGKAAQTGGTGKTVRSIRPQAQ